MSAGNIGVTVVVPFYNVQDCLKRCIDSVLNQSFTSFEIILVDDGSTDDSSSVGRLMCGVDSRIRYYYKKNGGVSSARNAGLSLAVGKYVMFIDADDTISENALDALYSAAEINDADIVYGKYCIASKEGLSVRQKLIDNSSNISAVRSLMSSVDTAVWDCLFRRELIENLKFDTGLSIGEDYRFLVEAFYKARRISSTNEVVYHYNRMSDTSVLASGMASSILKRKADTYNSIRDFLISQGVYPLLEERLSIKCLESIQEMSLYNELHSSFIDCIPEKKSYINRARLSCRMKFFLKCLCHNMGFVVELYNRLRLSFKCKQ